MKSNKSNLEEQTLKYNDLSTPEDDRLELIGSLLLQANGDIDENEARRVGEFIHTYLKRKKVLDSCFWRRTLSETEEYCSLFQAEVCWVESQINDT